MVLDGANAVRAKRCSVFPKISSKCLPDTTMCRSDRNVLAGLFNSLWNSSAVFRFSSNPFGPIRCFLFRPPKPRLARRALVAAVRLDGKEKKPTPEAAGDPALFVGD